VSCRDGDDGYREVQAKIAVDAAAALDRHREGAVPGLCSEEARAGVRATWIAGSPEVMLSASALNTRASGYPDIGPCNCPVRSRALARDLARTLAADAVDPKRPLEAFGRRPTVPAAPPS